MFLIETPLASEEIAFRAAQAGCLKIASYTTRTRSPYSSAARQLHTAATSLRRPELAFSTCAVLKQPLSGNPAMPVSAAIHTANNMKMQEVFEPCEPFDPVCQNPVCQTAGQCK